MAFFCESVSYEENGNMNIQGVYDRIILDPFAVFPTRCTLKVVVSAARGESEGGFTPLGIRWENPDGSQDRMVDILFQLPESRPHTSTFNVIATINSTGNHWLDLFIRGMLLTRIPLSVIRGIPAIQPQPEVVQ
jgi:hypothetical protein